MPNLAEQIREALSMFASNDTEPALIGGLAMVAHQVIRATKDVDFLVEAEAADKVHDALLKIHHTSLNMDELRDYFALFNQTTLLHDLLHNLPQ